MIGGFQGCFREVKGFSLKERNTSDLKVLNIFTGEWEELSSVTK